MSELPANLVEDALNAWAWERFEDRPPDGMWHPSSISSRCLRRSIYEQRGTPASDKRQDRSVRTLEVGKFLHSLVQEAMETRPGVVAYYHEVTVFDENEGVPGSLPTTGNSDDLLVFLLDGQEVWEVEEYKSKSANLMRSAKQLEELPEPDHIFQTKTYIRALRKNGATTTDGGVLPASLFHNLTAGRITYVSKDDLKIAEYPLQYNPEIDDAMIDDRIAELEAYRRDPNSLPPRLPLVTKTPKGRKPYTEKDWLCGVCPWAYLCWDEDPDMVLPIIQEGLNATP